MLRALFLAFGQIGDPAFRRPLILGALGAAASIAARGAVGARAQWYRPGETSPDSPTAAPRPAGGLKLNLGQLLLPSPRLWRAT